MPANPPVQSRGRPEICFQCRNRKVRCDGKIGGCENCRRLDFDCSLAHVSEHLSHDELRAEGGVARRRAAKACIACREKKSRCMGLTPPCERCRNYGIECVYPSIARRRPRDVQRTAVAASSPSVSGQSSSSIEAEDHSASHPAESSSPKEIDKAPGCNDSGAGCRIPPSSEFMHQKAIIREHIDAFFDNIYPIPGMGFIHRPSLMRTWLDGSHSPRLLQAICGVAARFTAQSRPNMALQGQRWLEEAEMHLQHRSTDLLRTDIAALILIAFDHGVSRRFLKHISTLASVTRLAVIMRLHHEVPNLVFRRQEWRRRLIWAIWAMDAISSGGCSDLSSCPTKLMHARLPCNERSYNFNVAVDVHPLGSRPQSDGCGLSAYLVSILDVRRRFLEAVGSKESLDSNSSAASLDYGWLIGLAQTVEQEIQQYSASLPDNYVLNNTNLYSRLYSPSRTTFVMLHVWIYRTSCDLHRSIVETLPRYHPGHATDVALTQALQHSRHQYRRAALNMVSLFSTLLQIDPTVFITDPMIASCSLSAAQAIYAFHSWGVDLPHNTGSTTLLQYCADILTKPSEVYPTVKIVRGEILELRSRLASNLENGASDSFSNLMGHDVADEISRLQFALEDPERPPADSPEHGIPMRTQDGNRTPGPQSSLPIQLTPSSMPMSTIAEIPFFEGEDMLAESFVMDGEFQHRGVFVDMDQMEQSVWSMPGFGGFDLELGTF